MSNLTIEVIQTARNGIITPAKEITIHIQVKRVINLCGSQKKFGGLSLWKNKELSSTLFGGKQNYDYWEHIFRTSETLDGKPVLTKGLNAIDMIKA